MPDETDLSEQDKSLLQARLEEYRSTPNPTKEAFRIACAKYILRSRQLDDSDAYKVKFMTGKVRNWFQNHTEKRSGRLPLRIYNDFSPMRIWGHKNRDLIRDTVAEANDGEEPDDRAYIVQWNETVHRLWDELPDEEQQPYVRLAELWAVQGPDNELKPWMAEKRGPAWMRSVGSMFWTQCGMPVFIYGMFKDTNGRLRATVYDTTELWADADPTTPLFRNVKSWDQDFRRKAWTFFQAILEPEHATQDTLALVQGTRRQAAAPFTFELHSDGTPILTDKENGKATPTYRRQRILREYLRIHYSHASGREERFVPWQSLRDNQEKFFPPGMLPEGFQFEDPSKITDDQLVDFFKHVAKIEARPEGQDNRFRFSHYQVGPKTNYSYLPAIYAGTYTPHEPRRAKKVVQPPTFEGAPSDDVGDTSRVSEPPAGLAAGPRVPGGSRMADALDADLDKVLQQIAAVDAAGGDAPAASPAATPGANSVPFTNAAQEAPPATDKGKHKAQEPWVDAEFVGAPGLVSGEWDDVADDFLEEAWVQVSSAPHGPTDGLDGASDDEVEGVLTWGHPTINVDGQGGDPRLHESASAGHTRQPPSTSQPTGTSLDSAAAPETFSSPPAPQTVAAEGSARFEYLRSLANDAPYQAMLQRMEAKIREVSVIRGKAPVFWVTWGHKSGHVPEGTQCVEKNVKALFKWVEKVPSGTAPPADVQRYCLGIGLLLSDLHFIANTDALSSWPEDLPGYLAYSELNAEHLAAVTEACDSAVAQWSSSDSTPTPSQDADVHRGTPVILPGGRQAKPSRARSRVDRAAASREPEASAPIGRNVTFSEICNV
uniref:3-isopropylmalate dehydrogenase (3-IPM-DH) (IMDH) ) n=1 Tax=Ganoderma boninense TaxID=34458 RepID=A0A5K1K6F0_9APHY|nr:3-isopropylmalate dehydrogenase (3-IPM-DH) (IMDH) (EC (Beta-IPM dehydrogenase) [Ganoderma boninense]